MKQFAGQLERIRARYEVSAGRITVAAETYDRIVEQFLDDMGPVERQLTGYSGLLSFELVRGDFESIRRFIDSLEQIHIGISWGGVESLITSPNRGSNGAQLDALGIPHGLVRLSVGLEGSEALIEDLASALAGLA